MSKGKSVAFICIICIVLGLFKLILLFHNIPNDSEDIKDLPILILGVTSYVILIAGTIALIRYSIIKLLIWIKYNW